MLQIAQKKKKKAKARKNKKLRKQAEKEQNDRKFLHESQPKIDYISTIENRKTKKSFECQFNMRNSPKSTTKT